MQTAGKTVGATRCLIEFAAGMQAGEDDLDHGRAFFRVQTDGYPPPVIVHRDAAIGFQGHRDFATETRKRLVSRVIDHLLHNVQGIFGTGIHPWPLADRFQTFQDPDRSFRVFRFSCGHGFG